ncbi:MAG: alpha/beta fold hydrolase [Ilumatobacteraceae bacterium]|jgi:putative redox protein|nr:alpha/beta fold hydrolase [Ilumatobacteraceae bacterium]
MSGPARRVTFPGSRGQLAGRLDLPAGPPLAWALFAHCFTCSKDLVAAGRIAAELNARRIAVLRFDFAGLGSSEGDFESTDFSSNLDDIRHAVEWLRAEHRAPQLLVGHSLGGAAVLSVAGELPEVRAVATIGAPADADHVTRLFAEQLDRIAEEGIATVDIGGRPFSIRRELVDDLRAHSVEERARALRAALLVLHSPIDNTVGIDSAARIFTAARHPKSFVALDGADHLLRSARDAAFAGQAIAAWAERYLDDEHPFTPAPDDSAPVVVAETGQGTFLNHVVVGEHHFLADEPVDVGGFDAGPSPYDLLGAALGACTAMTLRLYADRKGLALERVTVEVHHAKRHCDDAESTISSTAPGAPIDHFDRRLVLEGDLDAEARTSLRRIADRCPVHRTLESAAHIVTTLAEPT